MALGDLAPQLKPTGETTVSLDERLIELARVAGYDATFVTRMIQDLLKGDVSGNTFAIGNARVTFDVRIESVG
jgi:hypothetical protein